MITLTVGMTEAEVAVSCSDDEALHASVLRYPPGNPSNIIGLTTMLGARMNLCVVCRDMRAVSCSGMSRAMCDLAIGLAAEGHSVHLLVGAETSREDGFPGVSVEPVLAPPAPQRFTEAWRESAPDNLVHAAAVHREVRRLHEQDEPVDAVIAPLWRSEAAVCVLDDRFPTVVSCMTSLHTLVELEPPYARFVDLHERLALEREAMRRTQYLHGLTEAVLRKTISDLDLHPTLTTVVGRGLCDRRIEAPAAVNGDAIKLLFVGRLEQRKGVDVLLDAVRLLVEAEVPISLTLVGAEADPVFRRRFESTASPKLREAVRFAGAVPDAELSRLYATTDVVCVPSRYESHGVVVLEAMMFGKPIVSCRAGGLGEVVEHGRTGLLVRPDDAIDLAEALRRLAQDGALRERLGSCGRRSYEERFEARVVARQMARYLDHVVQVHRDREHGDGDVVVGLTELIEVVLGLAPRTASKIAHELVGPAVPPWRGRVRVGVHRARRRAGAVKARASAR